MGMGNAIFGAMLPKPDDDTEPGTDISHFPWLAMATLRFHYVHFYALLRFTMLFPRFEIPGSPDVHRFPLFYIADPPIPNGFP